jgi:hypothetical protein
MARAAAEPLHWHPAGIMASLEMSACMAPAGHGSGQVLSPIYWADHRAVPRDPLAPGLLV